MENKELIKKLKKEQDDLNEKIHKLDLFITKQDKIQTISDLQLNLLNVQCDAIILGERTPELVRVMNRPDKAPKRCFLFGFRFLWLYNLAAN